MAPAAAAPATGRRASDVVRRSGRLIGSGALALSLLAQAAALHAAAPVSTPVPKPAGCLIEPDRVAELGSPVVGIVERVHVERGDRVAAGQAVASLRSAVETANVSVAEMRARMDADVRASKASLDLAKQKVQRAESLVAQNFISTQALEQAAAEHELAVQKLNQARGQQQLWDGERRVAAAQLGLRVVRSPFAGVVVERYVNAGERVEEKPLFRVAVIDPLRVELMVSTQQFGSVKIGDTITVRPELPGVQPVVARVVHIDRVMDAASNTFRVRLTLPNPRDELPAGLRCKADLPAMAAKPAASEPLGSLPASAAARTLASSSAATALPLAAPTHPPAAQAMRTALASPPGVEPTRQPVLAALPPPAAKTSAPPTFAAAQAALPAVAAKPASGAAVSAPAHASTLLPAAVKPVAQATPVAEAGGNKAASAAKPDAAAPTSTAALGRALATQPPPVGKPATAASAAKLGPQARPATALPAHLPQAPAPAAPVAAAKGVTPLKPPPATALVATAKSTAVSDVPASSPGRSSAPVDPTPVLAPASKTAATATVAPPAAEAAGTAVAAATVPLGPAPSREVADTTPGP